MSSPSEGAPPTRSGVIHDLGYRPYAGPRLGERAVAWSLFLTGLRNCYGLGRSGRSKVLPMLLLAAMVLPAVILVAVLVQARKVLDLDEQLVSYSSYSTVLMLVITVFAASQAPALISRDLRFRTITLYLARPLRRSTYVLVRLASLTAAIFLLVAAPLVVMYVGGLLADLPWVDQTKQFLVALVGALVLALVLAGLSGLVSALTTRRGLAVAAVIVVVLVTFVVATSVIAIAADLGRDEVAALGGLLSPFTLVDGLQSWALGTEPASGEAEIGTGTGLLYLAVTVLLVGGSVVAMLLRYRRAAAA